MGRVSYDDLMAEAQNAAGSGRVALPIVVEVVIAAVVFSLWYGEWPIAIHTNDPSFQGWATLGGGALVMITGGCILLATVGMLRDALRERKTLSSGVVFDRIEAVVRESWLDEHLGENGAVYKAEASVAYEVDGDPFKGRIALTDSYHNFMGSHKRTLAKHAPGTTIDLYVNSRDPTDLRKKKPTNTTANLKLTLALLVNAMPAAMIGVGLAILVSGIHISVA